MFALLNLPAAMKKPFLLLFLIGVYAFPVLAQPATGEKWTLETCITYALQNNLQVQLNQLTALSSEEQYKQAQHARLPNLNGSLGQSYVWGRSFDAFTNAPITQRVGVTRGSVTSNVTVFNGFQIHNSIQQARLQLEANRLNVEQAKNDISLSIANFYLQILTNTELLANAKRQIGNTQEQIERTEKLVKAGALPELNLINLVSQKATDELNAINAQNALNLSYLQLKQLLQLTDSESFEVFIPEVGNPESLLIPGSSAEIFETASGIMPNIKSADISIEAARKGIRVAESGRYPSLSIFGSLGTNYSDAQKLWVTGYNNVSGTAPVGYWLNNGTPVQVFSDFNSRVPIVEDFTFRDQIREAFNRSVGLNLNIPIANRRQVVTNVNVARIQYERARVNAQQLRNQLRQSIEQAYLDAQAARQTYNANVQRVKALEETFRVTEQRYTLGASNVTDYNVNRNNLFNAQSDLIRAKYTYMFRAKVLDFYMGNGLKL